VPDHSTGGGGHIHIDCSEWEQIKVGREIASRPYLSWVFLHPSDDINGQSIAHWMSAHWGETSNARLLPFWMEPNLTSEQWKNRGDRHFRTYGTCREYAHSCKSSVVNMTGLRGLEFRAFTGAYDLHEQLLHMAFVQRYTDYCLAKETEDVPWENRTEARKFLESWRNYDKCETAFFDLILELGLDPNAYAEYPEVWMKPRFTKRGMGKLI
jgi:hypothetical protein